MDSANKAAAPRAVKAWAIAGVALANLAVSGVCAYSAIASRSQVVEAARQMALSQVDATERAMSERAGSTVRVVSAAAARMEDEIDAGRLDVAGAEAWLRKIEAGRDESERLHIYDEAGRWIAGGDPKARAKGAVVADAEYFKSLKADPKMRVFFDRVRVGRNSGGVRLGVAAPIRRADGSFAGVVVGRITGAELSEIARPLANRPGDSFEVRDSRDYALLGRVPSQPGKSDADAAAAAKFMGRELSEAVKDAGSAGSSKAVEDPSGKPRTIAFKRMASAPLVLVGVVDHGEEIAAWRSQATAAAAFAALFLLISGFGVSRVVAVDRRAKRAEQELFELNAGLERQVAERSRELEETIRMEQQARESLAQAERLASLGAMVAGVAHELNTPLGNAMMTASAIVETSSALAAKIADGTVKKSELARGVERLREMGRMQEISVERAGELVRSFKQVAVDQTSSRRRKFDLSETLRNVAASFAPTLAKAATKLEVDVSAVPGGLTCDSYPGPLIQIASNLLQNALKHGFEGRASGRFVVSGGREERVGSGDWAWLAFEDDGSGMPEAIRERAFQRFATSKADSGGSGLGLWLSAELAHSALGGSLELLPPGALGGCRFELRFPMTRPEASEPPAAPDPDAEKA